MLLGLDAAVQFPGPTINTPVYASFSPFHIKTLTKARELQIHNVIESPQRRACTRVYELDLSLLTEQSKEKNILLRLSKDICETNKETGS